VVIAVRFRSEKRQHGNRVARNGNANFPGLRVAAGVSADMARNAQITKEKNLLTT
jgi:hypothetical protein